MNNNFNNEKQNNKNNNESLLGRNDYPNYSNSNKHNQKLVRICKYCSISYIVLFLISIAFIVVGLSIYLYSLGGDQYRFVVENSWLVQSPLLQIMAIIVTPIVACILLILNIVLIITTIYLYKCHLYDDRSSLMNVWFWVGLFLIIPSFVGCILSIFNCNKIKKLYFNNTVIVKKSWKVSAKTFVAFGSIASIIGAGLTGGTYGSYSNYMLLKGMENVVKDNSLGYNLSYDNVRYLHALVGDYDYGNGSIGYKAFGEYTIDNYQTIDIDNLTDFFNCYSNILEWLSNTQNNEGIIDYLSSMNKSSLSSDDSNLVSQTINDFNNLKSSLSNGFPNTSTIENILSNITESKNDNIASDLENALNPYNESSGLLSIISSIDSDLTQLINDKVIDLSSSNMNSTTKQYFENYISLLGTNSANLIDVNQSGFLAMFDTTSAMSVFNNTDAIGLNDLSLYLLDSNSLLYILRSNVTTTSYFETLSTLYQFPNSSNQEVYRLVFSQISPEAWNKEIINLTSHGKTHMNQVFQNQLNAFYNLYPAEDSYEQAMSSTNLSDYGTIYNLQDYVYYLDCNYDANQDGVIAGSVLLAIGLVALIISATSLGIIRKKEKKEAK